MQRQFWRLSSGDDERDEIRRQSAQLHHHPNRGLVEDFGGGQFGD